MEEKEIIEGLMRMFLPKEFTDNFIIEKINESKETWEVIMKEKEDKLPEAIKGKQVVKDGFCNPVELQSFPIKGKAFYIKLFRRRWKESGTQNSYSNTYDLHEEGMKATREFGAFLKETLGVTPAEFSNRRVHLMRRR